MEPTQTLQRAIQAAKAGQKAEARALLIQIVERDARNETAWIWLSGLVDSLEDRIVACENALTINPSNEKVRAYLAELRRQQASLADSDRRQEAARLLAQAKEQARRKDMDAARRLARQAVESYDGYEEAWYLLGRVSADVDQQLEALNKAYRLNPSNPRTVTALKRAQHLKANPLSAATRLEQLGKYDEALQLYQELAAKARDSREFDHIYNQIVRIERLQDEQIRHVAPGSSIARLSVSWPLLYLSLALMQMGLNPFAHPVFYLWLGLPFVILGSFLLSLAEIRSRHVIWQSLFDEHGDGSLFARFIAAATGWILVLVPHVLLVLDSLGRLRSFRIPLMPF